MLVGELTLPTSNPGWEDLFFIHLYAHDNAVRLKY